MFVADAKQRKTLFAKLHKILPKSKFERMTPQLTAAHRTDLASWLLSQLNQTPDDVLHEREPLQVPMHHRADLLIYLLKAIQTVPLWVQPWIRLLNWANPRIQTAKQRSAKRARGSKRSQGSQRSQGIAIRTRRLSVATRRRLFQQLPAPAQQANWFLALARATDQVVHQLKSASFWSRAEIQAKLPDKLAELFPGFQPAFPATLTATIRDGVWLTSTWTGQMIHTLQFPPQPGPLVGVKVRRQYPPWKSDQQPQAPEFKDVVQFQATVHDEACIRQYTQREHKAREWPSWEFVPLADTLSPTQRQALEAIRQQPVTLVIGEAGTGKSYLLSQLAQLGPYNICFTTPYRRTVGHLRGCLERQLQQQGWHDLAELEAAMPCFLCSRSINSRHPDNVEAKPESPAPPESPEPPEAAKAPEPIDVSASPVSRFQKIARQTAQRIKREAAQRPLDTKRRPREPAPQDSPQEAVVHSESSQVPCSWARSHDSLLQVGTTCSWSTHFTYCHQPQCHKCQMRVLVIDEIGLASTANVANALRWVSSGPDRRLVLAGDPCQMPTISGGSVLAALMYLRPDWIVRLEGDQRTSQSEADNAHILKMARAILDGDTAIPEGRGVDLVQFDRLASVLPRFHDRLNIRNVVLGCWNTRVRHLNRYLANHHRQQLEPGFQPVPEPQEDSNIPGFKWIPPFPGAIVQITAGDHKDRRGVVRRTSRERDPTESRGFRYTCEVELDAKRCEELGPLLRSRKRGRALPPSRTAIKLAQKQVRFAYAMTVNSAQGSEFDHVGLLLDDWSKLNARFLYTAVTRAKVCFTLLQRRHDPVYTRILQRGFPSLVPTTLIAFDVSTVASDMDWRPPVLVGEHLPTVVDEDTGVRATTTAAGSQTLRRLIGQSTILSREVNE